MTQFQLIDGAAPKRPTDRDDTLREKVADRLVALVRAWAEQEGEPCDAAAVHADLVNALDREYQWDGYSLARELERSGWVPDSELVEILDNAGHFENDERHRRISQWVSDYNIKPTFAIGALVTFDDDGESISGEIISIDSTRATYTVYCESLGHVRRGTGRTGAVGRVIPFEDAKAQ